jgi:hypothetical protein
MSKCVTVSEIQNAWCKAEAPATDYSIHIYHSVKDIPALTLEHLGSEKHFFFSSGYWNVFEHAFSKNIQFRYVVVSHNGEAVGLAPFQLIMFKGSNVSNEVEEKGWWQQTKKYITGKVVNLISMRLLVSGNTFLTGEFAFHLKPGLEFNSKKAQAFHAAIQQIVAEEKNISGILIKDFYAETATHLDTLKQNNFLQFEVNPNMEVDILPEWNSMKDYGQALSSRYRIRYHKALDRASGLECRNLDEALINRYEPQLQTMLSEILERSDFKLESPDIEYMKALRRQFPDSFHLKGIFKGDVLLGFYSAYHTGSELYACFVGMDKSLLKEHDLYLNILYKLLELAIDLKVTKLHYGRTAMEIKSSVGAKPKQMYLYVKHVNPVINRLVHFAVKTLSKNPEWTLRNPFKKSSVA